MMPRKQADAADFSAKQTAIGRANIVPLLKFVFPTGVAAHA